MADIRRSAGASCAAAGAEAASSRAMRIGIRMAPVPKPGRQRQAGPIVRFRTGRVRRRTPALAVNRRKPRISALPAMARSLLLLLSHVAQEALMIRNFVIAASTVLLACAAQPPAAVAQQVPERVDWT